MRRVCGVACLLLVALVSPALAKPIMIQPVPQRVALADAVIVGTVTGIEDMDIETTLVPGGGKVEARIAVVSVGDMITGAKDLKSV